MATRRTEWLSAHLSLPGNIYAGPGDKAVSYVIAPFFSKCDSTALADSFFFVRYGEGGPHVRIRWRVRPEDAWTTVAILVEALQHVLPSVVLAPWPGVDRQASAVVPRVSALQGVASKPELTLDWVPYEPELQRYGGRDGMRIAHHLFTESTRTVMQLLREKPEISRSERLGSALALMLGTLRVFINNRAGAAAFVAAYGSQYLRSIARDDATWRRWLAAFEGGYSTQSSSLARTVDVIWRALGGRAPDVGFARFVDVHSRARDRLRRLHREARIVVRGQVPPDWRSCVMNLLPSYLHMTNNRLGLTLADESYLCFLVSRVLIGVHR